MSWKERTIEALVGGLGGLIVVVTFIVVSSALGDTSQSDWLSFAGAMLGTGFAVLGAVGFENWKRSRERIHELEAIKGPVVRIGALAKLALSKPTDQVSEMDLISVMRQLPDTLRSYTVRLDRAIGAVSSATYDGEIIEIGDMVLRQSHKIIQLFEAKEADMANDTFESLKLLESTCQIAVKMLESRKQGKKALTFEEAMEGSGKRLI